MPTEPSHPDHSLSQLLSSQNPAVSFMTTGLLHYCHTTPHSVLSFIHSPPVCSCYCLTTMHCLYLVFIYLLLKSYSSSELCMSYLSYRTYGPEEPGIELQTLQLSDDHFTCWASATLWSELQSHIFISYPTKDSGLVLVFTKTFFLFVWKEWRWKYLRQTTEKFPWAAEKWKMQAENLAAL